MLTANDLLRALPLSEQLLLNEHLRPRRGARGEKLVRRGERLDGFHFPETAMFSIQAGCGKREGIELDLIGREGVAGAFAILGETRAPYGVAVAEAGQFLTLSLRAFNAAIELLPVLRSLLMIQVHGQFERFAAQAAQVSRSVEQRLAALLAARLRAAEQISITHDELAGLLGVRRAGVTVALHALEGARAVRAQRGQVRLRDLEALRACADGRADEQEKAARGAR